MQELFKISLDELECFCLQENPNATEEEIRQFLYKAPYTKKEVDNYMISEERKQSELLAVYKKPTQNKDNK